MRGYAVVDVETTGLYAGGHDRVIEVAVVEVGLDGQVTGQWCTLVNPGRDLGPQHLHRVAAVDVLGAPAFEVVAGMLAESLAGRVLVGHNVAFDARMLEAEFARAGHQVPIVRNPAVCTMRLAPSVVPHATARTLAACCAAAGVPLKDAHSALGDALATAALFAYCLRASGVTLPWRPMLTDLAHEPWPSIAALPFQPVLRGDGGKREHFLSRIVDRLPRVAEPVEADAYLAVLDDALLDGYLSAAEQDALVACAAALGLGRDSVDRLHEGYLRALLDLAWEDGVVTDEESAELDQIAQLLGQSPVEVTDLVSRQPSGVPIQVRRTRLSAGDVVVLTGTMKRDRQEWIVIAEWAGLIVGANVTKKTRLVVAADPDSLSGKARKANDYRIPVVGEDAFARMVREMRVAPN